MLRRKKSMGDRFRELIPVFTLVAIGSASVVAGMNILASSPPVAISFKPTPTPTPAGPTFRSIPSYAIVTDPPI